jgi:hypothetical protein
MTEADALRIILGESRRGRPEVEEAAAATRSDLTETVVERREYLRIHGHARSGLLPIPVLWCAHFAG